MLNDNIIEFYLKYIRASNETILKAVNGCMVAAGNVDENGLHEFQIKKNFSKVKSWTKKVDIFKMDYIVLPINDEMHWFVCDFIFAKKAAPALTDHHKKGDYLECELVDKHGSGEGYLDRTRIGALYPQGVPHQENYVDCGLYLLQFAEAFLTKPPSGEVRGAFVFSLLMH
ncbi:unnamed protein product [Heligmosomoides polygyrus]|uniref:ULP_PROTEASE domain-containing protein n=1 Tax=Heligmosomoides polygyrus TaxID=6339 RepID=A0A183FW03_HELPZ|nr:unnamed protein product [Heligmosomoides polygyrus]